MNNVNLSGVYAITLVIDGRRYIGSAKNFRKRWYVHRSQLRNGKHHSQTLQRAWNKYGEDSFEFSIVEVVSDISLLVHREQFHLDNIYSKRRCFNSNPVAGSSLGRVVSDKTRRKISERAKGRAVSAVTRARMSDAHRGKSKTDEHREKLAAGNRERAKLPISDETKRRMSESAKARVSRSTRRKNGTFGAEHGVQWSDSDYRRLQA